MHQLVKRLESSLHKLSDFRDEILYIFIKPYWPRKITPNHITYVRLFIAIALAWLLFVLHLENKALIVTLFTIGVLTDLLDGSVARGLDKVTHFGAMLDSTCDRLLIIPIAVYSLQQNESLLLALLAMEIINLLFSLYYKNREIYIDSNMYGKLKMVIWSVVFIGILWVFPATPNPLLAGLLWLTVPLSLLSIFLRISDLKNHHANQ